MSHYCECKKCDGTTSRRNKDCSFLIRQFSNGFILYYYSKSNNKVYHAVYDADNKEIQIGDLFWVETHNQEPTIIKQETNETDIFKIVDSYIDNLEFL